MKRNLISVACALPLLLAVSQAHATTQSFEDVSGAVAGTFSNPVASGYQGLTWNNFFVVDKTYLSGIGGNVAGVTDGQWAAMNGASGVASITSTSAFDFTGASFTKLRSGTATVLLQAYSGNVLKYSDSFLVGSAPLAMAYSWTGIDKLVYTPTNGRFGTNVMMDQANITTVSAVPEPESFAMLLAGLGLMGVVARRRSKQA